MFRRFGIAVALLVLFIVGFAIFDKYDRVTNYVSVDAEIISVTKKCYLQKKERGVLTKTTSTTNEGPCEVMERLQASHPAYTGYELHKDFVVEFEYRSPADQIRHIVERKLVAERAEALHPYEHITVLAHKTDPEKTKWL